MTPQQAAITIGQLTVSTRTAIGARDPMILTDGRLSMRVNVRTGQRHWLIIELTPLDEYTLELVHIRNRTTRTVQLRAEHVYCNQLAETAYRMCTPVHGQGASWYDNFGIKPVEGDPQ